jgi:uncharacterized damage-inducible protein DinB
MYPQLSTSTSLTNHFSSIDVDLQRRLAFVIAGNSLSPFPHCLDSLLCAQVLWGMIRHWEGVMYRKIEDFENNWKDESEGTLKLLDRLTDASLSKKVSPDGRSLGMIAWHLVLTLGEMMGRTGLSVEAPDESAPVPASAAAIKDAYGKAACSLAGQVSANWHDTSLEDDLNMYGQTWKRGEVLTSLIVHQAHHRGQMTVLMRQAGLAVPGVYGPSRDEWSQYGMTPQR